MSKAQSMLKVCSRFAFLLTVLMTLVLLHRETSFAGSGSTMKSFSQGQPTRPFNMVTLGDSIMWGQGLPEQTKFRTLVANWLQSQYGNTRKVVEWTTHAHSGAKTGWGIYPAETNGNDPDSWYMTNPSSGYGPGYPYPGEVPFSYPSISFQIGMTVNDLQKQKVDPANVDLVLLDGGINDLSAINILNPSLVETNLLQGEVANGPNWVRTKTNELCVTHMQSLLPQVTAQFPNAVVIVTGYYPIVSGQTDLIKLSEYLTVLGLGGGAGPPAAGIVGGPGAALDYLVGVPAAAVPVAVALRAILADRSQAFATTAFNGLTNLVNQANQGLNTPQVALAWPSFSDDNAYAAPNSYLFLLEDFLDDEIRGSKGQAPPGDWNTPAGVAYYRAEECTVAHPSDPTCYAALVGHPNPKGAQAYADAIITKLQAVFAAKLGLPQPKALFTRLNSGTDTNGPYVYISNRSYEPPQVNNYWTQIPTWFDVVAVDSSNEPVQGNVAVQPIPPPYWPFPTQSIEAVDFGVLPSGYDSGLATLPNGTYIQPGEPTGRKIYYMCLPAGTPVREGAGGRPPNLRSFAGNQQGCWLQVSAPGYVTCVLQLGPAPSSANPLGGLFGSSATPGLPGPPCPAAPAIGETGASVQNSTIAGGLHAGMTGQVQQARLPALAAAVSSNAPSTSPITDTVTVTTKVTVPGKGGQHEINLPVAGATVALSNSTFVTNANGIAVITHSPCLAGSQVAKVGGTTVPKRVPVPCGWTATVSKAGYESGTITLP